MICLYYDCEQDLALKTSKEISQIRRGQMDIMDILDTTHDIVNGVTDLVLNDNTAYEYKRTVRDIPR